MADNMLHRLQTEKHRLRPGQGGSPKPWRSGPTTPSGKSSLRGQSCQQHRSKGELIPTHRARWWYRASLVSGELPFNSRPPLWPGYSWKSEDFVPDWGGRSEIQSTTLRRSVGKWAVPGRSSPVLAYFGFHPLSFPINDSADQWGPQPTPRHLVTDCRGGNHMETEAASHQILLRGFSLLGPYWAASRWDFL